ncbi:MAG: SOS response-associated peptidase family protein [Thermoplasmatota archaeon]
MAGLIGLTSSDIEVQDATGAIRWAYEGEWVPHPVVRLTTTLPAAVTAEDAVREVQRIRWGFPVGPRPVGNARDDKLEASPLWSKMLGVSHALFVSTGIYEMIQTPQGKQSYWFRRRDGNPIVMPGLVGERTLKDRKTLCGAIITTTPNDLFARYHPRQVCSLEPSQFDAWMAADADAAMELLGPAPNDAWEAVPVDSRIFGSGRREMEDLVPIGEPETIDTPEDEVGRPPAGKGQQRLGF